MENKGNVDGDEWIWMVGDEGEDVMSWVRRGVGWSATHDIWRESGTVIHIPPPPIFPGFGRLHTILPE